MPQPAPAPQPFVDPRYNPAYLPTPTLAAKLILESGLGKEEYPLDAMVTTIGRSRSNDISLDDARVSRHHARIVRDERGYLIEDLNSRNGTRVDDRAVRDSQTLTDGALVKIGDAVFRFRMDGSNNASPPPPPLPPSPFQPEQISPSASIPMVFSTPWSPVLCPVCQGEKTMRPVVYGDAAKAPAAIAAAQRGEIAIGEGPPHPNAANAECRACGTRVRIVQTGG